MRAQLTLLGVEMVSVFTQTPFPCSSRSYNSKGELGLGDTQTQFRIKRLDSPSVVNPVVSIAMADYHTLLLDSEGRVFVAGDNTAGRSPWEGRCCVFAEYGCGARIRANG